MMMNETVPYKVLVAIIVLLFVVSGWSQTPPTPRPTPSPAPPADSSLLTLPALPSLEWHKQDKADEYLFILQRLRRELIDFNHNIFQPENMNGHVSLKNINWIQERLDTGIYSNQPQTLLDDLTELISKIRREESNHRLETNSTDGKCCRSARSFRFELSIISELIEEYTDNQGIDFLAQKEIQQYISLLLMEFQETKNSSVPMTGIENGHDTRPGLTMPPDIDIINRMLKREIEHFLTETPSLNKQYIVKMTVENDFPIVINCPSGIIQIVGSDHYQMEALLTVKISADSKLKEKELSDMISLSASNRDDGYFLSVNLPTMSDLGSDISRSVLLVEVPSSNPIICNSSFSDLTIANMDAPIEINSVNSNIEIEDVNADIALTNSMGDINLNRVFGDITVRNANASIEISNCSGKMIIENIYSDIRLSETSGDVKIRNSGLIKIKNHSGQLSLNNNYGKIEVKNVDGDLTAINSYKPLIVTRVTGSIRLKNEYSSIKVNHVEGLLSIQNREGLIFAENLSGPVELDNRGGMINLIIDEDFSGLSSITASNGTINLTLIGEPDIDLKVHTIDGTISSSLPISVTELKGIQSAELMLGSGGSRLDIEGRNSAIIINSR